MKYEAELYLTIIPKRNRSGEISGAQIGDTYRKPRPGAIRLSISVPESWFEHMGPTIKAELGEKEPEVWDAVEVS
jgi:hypothetical protein